MTLLRVMQAIGDAEGLTSYWMWCPACDDAVRITSGWEWNGSLDKPTFKPSIKTTGVQWPQGDTSYKSGHPGVAPGKPTVCHSFLTDGVWNFLADCTHSHKGESMPMVDLPDWIGE